MVLGNLKKVFLSINVVSKGRQRIKALRRSMRRLGTQTKQIDKETGKTTSTFTGFRMEMLSVMFAGMQLMAVFGGIIRSMLKFTGVGTALSSALKTVMLPIILAITPALLQFAEILMGLPRSVKMIIGVLVIAAAIFGALLFVASQFILVLGAISVGAGTMVAAILGVIAGLGILVGGLIAGMEMVKRFGKAITSVILILLGLVGVILGLPLAIPAALVAVAGAFWMMRDEIVQVFKDIMLWIGKTAVGIAEWVASLPGKIASAASDLLSAGKKLGKQLINGVINGIKALGSALANAFFNILPGPLSAAVKGATGFAGDLVSGITNVISADDFVVTSGGQIIQPSPQDTIIGTKNPEALGGGGSITINFQEPQIDSEVDIDRLIERVKEDVEREMTGRGLT